MFSPKLAMGLITLFCYFFLIYFDNRKQKPGKGCKVQLNGYLLLFDRSIDGEVWVAAQAILMLEMSSDLCLMVFVGWLWGMEQWTQSFVWNGWTWQKGTKIFNFYLLPNFLVLFVTVFKICIFLKKKNKTKNMFGRFIWNNF